MVRRVVSRCAAVAALVSLAASSGCIFSPKGGDGITPGVSIYRPLTTPYAPLANLAEAYKQRDQEAYDKYAELFDPTLYQFIWDDPAEPGLDNYYGYTEEMKTRNMFTDQSVTRIDLTFLANASDSSGVPSNTVGDPAGTQRFTVNGISLTLDRPPTTFVTNGTAEFFVAPTETLNTVPQWKIIRWRDRTAPPISVAPSLQQGAPSAGNGSALLRAAALADELAKKQRTSTN